MAIDSIKLGDTLVTTMLEPDAVKRELETEAWLDSAVPILQADLREQLREYIRGTVKKGVSESKARQYVFRLSMDFNLVRVAERSPSSKVGTNSSSPQTTTSDGGGDAGLRGHSPNDDRSDSMNPNNPAHQSAMDNRSNQMNPNNSAYGSSRGGGRGR